jgi:hypothetical protein
MPIMIYNGGILLDAGELALDPDCCCGEPPACDCCLLWVDVTIPTFDDLDPTLDCCPDIPSETYRINFVEVDVGTGDCIYELDAGFAAGGCDITLIRVRANYTSGFVEVLIRANDPGHVPPDYTVHVFQASGWDGCEGTVSVPSAFTGNCTATGDATVTFGGGCV